MHKYQAQFDRNIVKAKTALPDWELAKIYLEIAIEYLELQKSYNRLCEASRPKLSLVKSDSADDLNKHILELYK